MTRGGSSWSRTFSSSARPPVSSARRVTPGRLTGSAGHALPLISTTTCATSAPRAISQRQPRTGTRTHMPAQVRTDLPAHRCEATTTHTAPGERPRRGPAGRAAPPSPARRHAGSPETRSQSATQPGRRRAHVAAAMGGCRLLSDHLLRRADLIALRVRERSAGRRLSSPLHSVSFVILNGISGLLVRRAARGCPSALPVLASVGGHAGRRRRGMPLREPARGSSAERYRLRAGSRTRWRRRRGRGRLRPGRRRQRDNQPTAPRWPAGAVRPIRVRPGVRPGSRRRAGRWGCAGAAVVLLPRRRSRPRLLPA